MPHDHYADYLRHTAEAEDLLPLSDRAEVALPAAERIAVAQVRATLALASALMSPKATTYVHQRVGDFDAE